MKFHSLPCMTKVLLAVAALTTLTACSESYMGRFVMLRGPDVEDYRHLPTRTVANTDGALPLPERLNGDWMSHSKLSFAGVALDSPAALDRFLREHDTTAFIVLELGSIVDERYFGGYRRDSLFKSFSMSKSVLSALLGIAQNEGLLRASDRVGDHVAGFDDTDVENVTLQQLLDNVAGFEYERGFAPWKQQPQMYYTTDVRHYLMSARLGTVPGSAYVGEDLSPLLLAFALDSALRKRGNASSVSDYASTRLWRPLGAQYPALWTLDRRDEGLEKAESGFVARAIDLARFGQLYLDDGKVGSLQVVPADWVLTSTTPPAKPAPNLFTDGFHKNLWWGTKRANRVRDDFYANGHFGQRIYICPDRGLVLVRLGSDNAGVDWTAFLGTVADKWQTQGPNKY
jgi:CubicO group peptidase (beta-lactamase class C family)